jgi:hypothetical protein
MTNIYIDKLLAAANEMTRPRFAGSLILAVLSKADNIGVIRATRVELADMVDRSLMHKRHEDRLRRLEDEKRDYLLKKKELAGSLRSREISQEIYDQEMAALTERYRKLVRNPTLSNVSRVMSHLCRRNLVSVSYVDTQTGQHYDTAARGRFAEYRLKILDGQTLNNLPGADQVHSKLVDHELRDDKETAAPEALPSPSTSRMSQQSAVRAKKMHQLSLF